MKSRLKELQLSPLTFLLLRISYCTKLKMQSKSSCIQMINRLEIYIWPSDNHLGVRKIGKEENVYCACINTFNIGEGFQTVWNQTVMLEFCRVRRTYCIANRSLNFTCKSSWKLIQKCTLPFCCCIAFIGINLCFPLISETKNWLQVKDQKGQN